MSWIEGVQLALGGGAVAMLSGIFTRLGRALAQLEYQQDKLRQIERRICDVEQGRSPIWARLLREGGG